MTWRNRMGTVRLAFFALLSGAQLYTAVTEPALRWLALPLALFCCGMTVKALAFATRRTGGASTDSRCLRLMRAQWALYGLAGLVVLVEALAMMAWVPALLTACAAFCWIWTCGWVIWSLRPAAA